MSKLQPVRGTQDICGEDARRFAFVVETFYRVAAAFGFERISLPIFEFTEVFRRPLGDSSDVVTKEMYTFKDRGGEEITLRPEVTASIARAYLSEGMQQKGVVKLATHGAMFRYERPQKGRYRQFHQLDSEIIGAPEPAADVEIIALAWQVLKALGISKNVVLNLNTLGDSESRSKYRSALVKFLEDKKTKLSKESRERLKKNPLRILDTKDAGDLALLKKAPSMGDFLNKASADFFRDVQAGLKNLGIPYLNNERLVRGLDYYCHTAFEFITEDLGAQGTVIGGGRYDGLIGMMGGPETPGTGWAGGIERLALMVKTLPPRPRPVVFVPMTGMAEALSQRLCFDLREAGIFADMAFRGNLKKRLQKANRENAGYAVIIGEDEMKSGKLTLRDLDTGIQTEIAAAKLLGFLKKPAGS
ncbi:MAG TPA: histidine--tRNA ligase [Sphingomonadales bacterium]|nr:histidine--tRNA ligase [Sphingomonadales bacterium]